MGQPLYLDERLEEQERARLKHALARWLKKLFPGFAFNGPRPARRSIEAQLLRRSHFSAEAWRHYGPLPDVVAILETIRRELDLPNHYFIPPDPLVLIMNSAYDIDDVYALSELEERYATKYTEEELKRIREEGWTLGRFVEDLLNRGKAPASDAPL